MRTRQLLYTISSLFVFISSGDKILATGLGLVKLPPVLSESESYTYFCSPENFEFIKSPSEVVKQDSKHLLMPIATTKTEIDGFDEHGQISSTHEELRDQWWELFNFQHILSFGDDPEQGPLKLFSFRLIFTGFLFPPSLDEGSAEARQAFASEKVCIWLKKFVEGNQHKFIERNMARTSVAIDLQNYTLTNPEIQRAIKQRGDLIFNSTRMPTFPAILFNGSTNLGPIYDGALSLWREKIRIQQLIDAPSDKEREPLRRLSNKSIYDSYASKTLYRDGVNSEAAEAIEATAQELMNLWGIKNFNRELTWKNVFDHFYTNNDDRDFQEQLRAGIVELTDNQGDLWLLLQLMSIYDERGSEFSEEQNDKMNLFLQSQTAQNLRRLPAALSLSLRRGLSYSLVGRLDLKQTRWDALSRQKMLTLHYRFCLMECGETAEDHFPRQPRRVQLYDDDRGSRFRNSEDQFVVMLNEWYSKESPRSPFQELVFETQIRVPTIDNLLPRFSFRMPLIYAGLGDEFIQHDAVVELSRLNEVELSNFPIYVVNQVTRRVEQLYEMKMQESRQQPASTAMELEKTLTSADLSRFSSGSVRALKNGEDFSGDQFYSELLSKFSNLDTLNLKSNQLIAPKPQAFWKRDICRPEYWQNASLDLNELMKCFEGKVIVISLGAPWCLPCKTSAPLSRQLYQVLQDEGLVILNFQVIDEHEAEAAISSAGYDYQFPSILLSRATQESLGLRKEPSQPGDKTGISSKLVLPTYLYRDAAHEWRAASVGGALDISIVESLLKERDPSFSLSDFVK